MATISQNPTSVSTSLTTNTPATPSTPYTIQQGDTLSALAAKNNTTVADLAKLNNITDPNKIYAGKTLNLGNQSTTTLTSDKSADIANNNKKLTDLSNKGLQTDAQGNVTHADGTIAKVVQSTVLKPDGTQVVTYSDGTSETKPSASITADTSNEDAQINDYYTKMTQSLDAQTKQAIDNIKTKFEIS